MERKKLFYIDRASGEKRAKDFFLRSVMAFTLVHQPTQITASPDNKYSSDISDRRQANERVLVIKDNSLQASENVVFPQSSVISSESEQTTKSKPSAEISAFDWSLDPQISFFGPGLYGRRTACGLELTKDLIGVASRTLPCGTSVTFKWNGKEVTAPVVDWGPAKWTERIFDLTGGACMAFKTPEQPKGHCFTGPINYKVDK